MILLIAQNQNIHLQFLSSEFQLVDDDQSLDLIAVFAVPVITDPRTCPLHNLCLRDFDPIEIIMLAASSIKVKFID